jgi:phosphoribosyl 1,2-cyclic phosphodiesterase
VIRFAMLGSGSGGNGTLVQAGSTTVLMDCGFMLRETEARLRRLEVKPWSLAGIVVTHEHYDHIGGVARFARKFKIPVWVTAGTRAAWTDGPVPRTHTFDAREPFTIGELRIAPFAVPHDAREPCHYVFGDGTFRVGAFSDAGSVTDGMRAALTGCDALMVEFNHDADLLANGPYEPPLKRRIAGPLGHLSNAQAAELVAALDNSRLRHLVLTHLSEVNNTPDLALTAARQALHRLGSDPDCASGAVPGSDPDFAPAKSGSDPIPCEIICARQDLGLDWRVLQ